MKYPNDKLLAYQRLVGAKSANGRFRPIAVI